jgi:large subunit ribosomal protein L17e
MVRYSRDPANTAKSAMARGSNLRVHYKNCREVGAAIKGMNLTKAITYLEAVRNYKRAVPFKRHTGGCGRNAQGKAEKAPGNAAGWPVKACAYFLDLLRNAEANAETKGLEVDTLYLSHVQVNRAPKMRRRTYRAHGRIGAYMASPAHIELIVEERTKAVPKAEETGKVVRKSRKQVAKQRLVSGGGVTA